MVFPKQGRGGQGPGGFRSGRSKLLNKRGFRGRIAFPLARKTRYNSPDYRVERDAGRIRLTRSVPKRAIGWATFRAYMGKVARECDLAIVRDALPPALIRHRPESECDVDIYTIIFLALAVFIFLRLRNVLGQRTGSERPPYDRAARDIVRGAQDNNVVPMPGTVIDQAPLAPTADVVLQADRWKGVAEPGTPLAQGLDAIAAQDSSFDLGHFLSGARSAYEMIVSAFASGDRRSLRDLLSPEVYESFDAVIKDRERHEQKTETRFVSIDKAELVGAEARDRSAQLTVRFVSQMVSVTRDKAGAIVDGNPEKVTDITDVWTFARDTASRDPNWKLVGTESTH